ncbi:hypothetical protein SCLCIDRAFT_586417 [Scleroderma citrinum Foug A]|uniref:Cysteine synthase 1 n=1 Tax=Scleroderma citrinum Foug A TaxID=1036808 RepID=A0A0C3AJH9_9AGAM|nr:hypothetical protein SCLCIDRAFT_586417 [Scleroderma citrinum Foug A]
MKIADRFTGAVGNTPLIYLKTLSERSGCKIFAKAEFQNPGGSVKDRAAVSTVCDAEKKGLIKPGGTVVEGTGGNTGIGLAHVCRSKGYRCVIFMPNTQSQEKTDLLRMLGAEVYVVPDFPYKDPRNHNHLAKEYAEKLENAIWTNQFDNTANAAPIMFPLVRKYGNRWKGRSTGSYALGTGGTLAGTGKYLKEKSNGKTQVWLAVPPDSMLYTYISSGGKLSERSGSSVVEGIGQGRVTANLGTFVNGLDGLYVGASSALNVVAAIELAQKLGKGSRVATAIPDGAYRYQSRLFSKKWLHSNGLYHAVPEHLRKCAVLH